jgi:hypothetical protein
VTGPGAFVPLARLASRGRLAPTVSRPAAVRYLSRDDARGRPDASGSDERDRAVSLVELLVRARRAGRLDFAVAPGRSGASPLVRPLEPSGRPAPPPTALAGPVAVAWAVVDTALPARRAKGRPVLALAVPVRAVPVRAVPVRASLVPRPVPTWRDVRARPADADDLFASAGLRAGRRGRRPASMSTALDESARRDPAEGSRERRGGTEGWSRLTGPVRSEKTAWMRCREPAPTSCRGPSGEGGHDAASGPTCL